MAKAIFFHIFANTQNGVFSKFVMDLLSFWWIQKKPILHIRKNVKNGFSHFFVVLEISHFAFIQLLPCIRPAASCRTFCSTTVRQKSTTVRHQSTTTTCGRPKPKKFVYSFLDVLICLNFTLLFDISVRWLSFKSWFRNLFCLDFSIFVQIKCLEKI